MKYIIIGTDTDVGKTVVASCLVSGLDAILGTTQYIKIVQTGCELDVDFVKQHSQKDASETRSFFHFAKPMSVDQAANEEGCDPPRVAQVAELMNGCKVNHAVFEAAGGLLVPLNEQNETWLDLLTELGSDAFKLILVARSGLGTLNHTSLTLEVLKNRGLEPVTVVLNGPLHIHNLVSLQRLFPKLDFHSFNQMEGLSENEDWTRAGFSLAEHIQGRVADLVREQHETSKAIKDSDERHVWHPYTQHKTQQSHRLITGAGGVWLTFSDGHRAIDGTSSWWVNNLGHGRKQIGAALSQQQASCDHVIFAGSTHESGAMLAQKLVSLTNNIMHRVFYSDNGSTAVEVSLKMASQYWQNRNRPEKRGFLSFKAGYHGDTFGVMAIGKSNLHHPFHSYFFQVQQARPLTQHRSYLCPQGVDDRESVMQELERIFEREASNLAAIVIEPLIQGAGGMLMQPEQWLRDLVELARQNQVLVIFDEVFTGLGRIGSEFAFLRAGVEPDIACIAKGLTGGTMPLAVTLAKDHVFNAFLSDKKEDALLHGHSFTGNPIGCKVALESIKLLEDEKLVSRAMDIERFFQDWIQQKAATFGIENPRCKGATLAFELPGSGFGDYFNPNAKKVVEEVFNAGLFLRPLGNTLYLVPPLSITPDELNLSLRAIEQGLSILD